MQQLQESQLCSAAQDKVGDSALPAQQHVQEQAQCQPKFCGTEWAAKQWVCRMLTAQQ